jgi:flagellar biogenesis protein FliO
MKMARALSLFLAVLLAVPASMAAPEPDPRAPEAYADPFSSEIAPPAEGDVAPVEAEAVPSGETAPAEPGATEPASAEGAPAASPSGEAFEGWEAIKAATDAALDAAEASAPQPESGASPVGAPPFSRMVLNAAGALLVALALIVAVYIVARRLNRGGSKLLGGAAYGRVLGRMPLDHRTVLHFVAVGEKVLVVAVTQGSVALLGTFNAEVFETPAAASGTPPAPGVSGDFLAQLQASAQSMDSATGADDDVEIASLRNDIERLQRYLKEGPREPEE